MASDNTHHGPSPSSRSRGGPPPTLLPSSSLIPPSFTPHPARGGSVLFGAPSVAFYPPSGPLPSSFSLPPHGSLLLPPSSSPPLPAFANVGGEGPECPPPLGVPCGARTGPPPPCGVSLPPIPPGASSFAPSSSFPVYLPPHAAQGAPPFAVPERREDERASVSASPPHSGRAGSGSRPDGNSYMFPAFPHSAGLAPPFADADDSNARRPREESRSHGDERLREGDGVREARRRDEGKERDGHSLGRERDRTQRGGRTAGRREGGRTPRQDGGSGHGDASLAEAARDDWGGGARSRRDEQREHGPRRGALSCDTFPSEGREDKRGRDEDDKSPSAWAGRGVSASVSKRPKSQYEANPEAGLLAAAPPYALAGALPYGGAPHVAPFPFFRGGEQGVEMQMGAAAHGGGGPSGRGEREREGEEGRGGMSGDAKRTGEGLGRFHPGSRNRADSPSQRDGRRPSLSPARGSRGCDRSAAAFSSSGRWGEGGQGRSASRDRGGGRGRRGGAGLERGQRRRGRDLPPGSESHRRRRSSETSTSSGSRYRRGSPSIQRPQPDDEGRSPSAAAQRTWGGEDRRRSDDGRREHLRRESCGSSISPSLSLEREDGNEAPMPATAAPAAGAVFPGNGMPGAPPSFPPSSPFPANSPAGSLPLIPSSLPPPSAPPLGALATASPHGPSFPPPAFFPFGDARAPPAPQEPSEEDAGREERRGVRRRDAGGVGMRGKQRVSGAVEGDRDRGEGDDRDGDPHPRTQASSVGGDGAKPRGSEDGKARAPRAPQDVPFFDLWVPTTFHPSCTERVRLVLGPKGRTHKEMEQLARMRIQIYGKEMIRSTRRHGYDAFRDNQPLHLVVTFDRMRREAQSAETAQRAQEVLKSFLEQLVERTWPREEPRRPESFYDRQVSLGPSTGLLVYVHPLGLYDEPPPKELQGCLVYKPNLLPVPLLQAPPAFAGTPPLPGVPEGLHPAPGGAVPPAASDEEAKKCLWGTDFSGRIFGQGFMPREADGDTNGDNEVALFEGDPTLLLDCTPPLCLLLLTLQSLHALLAEEGAQSLSVLPTVFEDKWGVRLLHSREDFQVAGINPSKRTQDIARVVDKPTGDDGYGGLLSFVQEFPEVFELVRDVGQSGEPGGRRREGADAEDRRESAALKVRAREVPDFARIANKFKTTNPWLERGG
ncbi:hypothetical protein BESB_071370 [Besnoitia besnoiti]|uniref:K Homology domain-containing protein n=1 Tax=Besnoitia besnoiti TaxID=94643 RepID=A0A2A9M7L4_BESBE|nr:uncharacterized protein BESB_071370 [Besnoitia besnoiti]PFH33985.1 hypothetical protein BESB_071370 [Besnoitia besnoiti]